MSPHFSLPALSQVAGLSFPSVLPCFLFSLFLFFLFNQCCVSSCLVISLCCFSNWKVILHWLQKETAEISLRPPACGARCKENSSIFPASQLWGWMPCLPSLWVLAPAKTALRKDVPPWSPPGLPLPHDAHLDPYTTHRAPEPPGSGWE